MRVLLKELHSQLGVHDVLMGYETDSSQYYDEERDKTCSAEVRMAGEQREIEVEILTFSLEPKEGEPPVNQILAMRGVPKNDGLWVLKDLRVKGDETTFPDWEKGACAFYTAIVLHIRNEQFPDIDALIDEHLQGEAGQAGRAKRGGGRKNPKFKPPTNTISMKQGM